MNHLVVCGLNYHSTPIAIRERFTIPESCVTHALKALSQLPHIKESVILSTCNRTEVYAAVSDVQAGLKEIESFFLSTQAIADHQVLKPNFKLLREDAALHLFRVASGLDSMILGEGQIMSQVKAAYQSAVTAGTAGSLLDQIFKLALTCGKKVRSQTSMGKRAVSVSSAAIELSRDQLGSLQNRKVLVIGAGKMAQLCVKHLLADGSIESVTIINRNPERIEKFLTNKLPHKEKIKTGFQFDDRYQLAQNANLVIVSTSAPYYLLEAQKFLLPNIGNMQCIVDISVPRNVDPKLADDRTIKLFNADDLSSTVNKNLVEREHLVKEAESIIFDTLDAFHAWQCSLWVVPTITGFRRKIEAIRSEQMRKNHSTGSDDKEKQRLEEISRAMVNQILHHPTIQLKSARDYTMLRQQAQALSTLFRLDHNAIPSRNMPRSMRKLIPVHNLNEEAIHRRHNQLNNEKS